jgi:DNA-binding transcriptional regulator PaaX
MIKNKEEKSIKEAAEDFFCSDSIPATATKFLLMTVALGGVAFIGALAPGLISLADEFKPNRKNRYSKKEIKNAAYNLKKRKLIEIIKDNNGKVTVKLTNKGQKRIKEIVFGDLKISKPKKWDKKWRVLIFDIPTKPKIYNQARNAIRLKVKELGFFQLQKSVWIYPYGCEDEILLVAEIYNVQKYIEILTVEKLLNENDLLKFFRL